MNNLTITRQNGNVPKSLAGEDYISGLIAYLDSTSIPEGFKTDHIHAVSTIDAAEKLGIKSDSEVWAIKVLHYHLSEAFRVNDGISLFVGIFVKSETMSFAEIKLLQNYASGKIRQIGIWAGDVALSADDIVKIQGMADTLDSENAPLSVVYAPKVTDITKMAVNIAGENKCRVSVLIAQAGSGTGSDLYNDTANSNKTSVTAVGTVIGLLSAASVHESIGWVRKFPTGISVPAFSDGTLYKDVDKALIEVLDSARYIFFVTYAGISGSYISDSNTMDSATSDYSQIENVRTMDKAVRGIRTYLIPELGGNVYIDSDTGKLQSYTVSHLETVANKALEDMEKAGELSGYKVEIDPDQNVLSSSTVEFVIKQVAVGVMRKIKIKIGFAKSV